MSETNEQLVKQGYERFFKVRDGKIVDFLEVFDNAAASKAFQKAATA